MHPTDLLLAIAQSLEAPVLPSPPERHRGFGFLSIVPSKRGMISGMRFGDLPLKDFGHTIQLVGAVYVGKGSLHIVLLPGEEIGGEALEPWAVTATPEDWSRLLEQTDFLYTEVDARGKDGSATKAIVRKCERQVDSAVSWKVFRRDLYECRYCGADNVPLTVDHLVSWESGGPSTEANLVACCRKCNRARGNTPYAEWLADPYYHRVRSALSAEQRDINIALAATLDQGVAVRSGAVELLADPLEPFEVLSDEEARSAAWGMGLYAWSNREDLNRQWHALQDGLRTWRGRRCANR